jgi:transcription elongation factor Elf1
MKLNCLSCGHSVDLRDDYSDYNGQVKCFVCGALLTIRTEDGLIKNVTLPPRTPRSSDEVVHNLS